MPTITGRSNTGLLGEILTAGRVAEAMTSPYGADADRILRPSLAAQPAPTRASAPSSAKPAAATRCTVFAGTRRRMRSPKYTAGTSASIFFFDEPATTAAIDA